MKPAYGHVDLITLATRWYFEEEDEHPDQRGRCQGEALRAPRQGGEGRADHIGARRTAHHHTKPVENAPKRILGQHPEFAIPCDELLAPMSEAELAEWEWNEDPA